MDRGYRALVVEYIRLETMVQQLMAETGMRFGTGCGLEQTVVGHHYLAVREAVYEPVFNLIRSIPFDVDAGISFLFLPMPAPGFCLLRTYVLDRLRRAPFTADQAQQLRDLAVELCASRTAGYCLQAFVRVRRLMVRIGTPDLIWTLAAWANHPEGATRRRTQAMLTAILQQRPDLPQVHHRP
ncbi:MAG: hypothetical protein H0T53_02375 [Herpetosiphonaceae bacterium]|nr:hypothetical protein [Herpetosiphonaceae bacterium]